MKKILTLGVVAMILVVIAFVAGGQVQQAKQTDGHLRLRRVR